MRLSSGFCLYPSAAGYGFWRGKKGCGIRTENKIHGKGVKEHE